METNRTQLSQSLMRVATGYQAAQAIFVATKLGVPDLLHDGAKSTGVLAQATGAHAPSLHRLLLALTALDILLESEQDQFALAPLGRCLGADEPGSIRPLVLMHGSENFWQTWGELLHCVRSGQTALRHLFGTSDVFDFYAQHPDVESIVSAGFAAVAESFAAGVIEAYDFSGFGTVVDVGCGRGRLLAAILRAYPRATGVLFDLPHVVQAATALLEDARLAERCSIVAGNMFESIPPGEMPTYCPASSTIGRMSAQSPSWLPATPACRKGQNSCSSSAYCRSGLTLHRPTAIDFSVTSTCWCEPAGVSELSKNTAV